MGCRASCAGCGGRSRTQILYKVESVDPSLASDFVETRLPFMGCGAKKSYAIASTP